MEPSPEAASASTGCSRHGSRTIAGTAGAESAPGLRAPASPGAAAGAGDGSAPASIQRAMTSISPEARGSPFGGMRGLASPRTRWRRRLSAPFPGTMSSPFFPPFSASSRVSSRRPPLDLSGPWQPMQRRSRIGRTSRAKSGGGGGPASAARTAQEKAGGIRNAPRAPMRPGSGLRGPSRRRAPPRGSRHPAAPTTPCRGLPSPGGG